MNKVGRKSNLTLKQSVLAVVVVTASIIYFVWRVFFTLPFRYGSLSLVFGILLLVCEGLGILEMVTNIVNRQYKLPEMPQIPEKMFPHVDVLIATHNEDADLLYKTINGCKYMKYPDKSKVHIYLCDDNDRPEINRLAKDMGVGYFGLSGNTEAKAGNLNNALGKTSSELVVTFDADMIPTSDFLLETVPYFALPKMKKENGRWVEKTPEEIEPGFKIGFVQIPQRFYNADLFQYNLYSEKSIPNEQDFFFREVNVGRTKTNSVIYAGSNTVICREALESVGGIVTGTITEDLATGIKIQEKGYRSLAVDKELAHGLSPENFTSLVKQRQRWGRGGIQVMGRPSFWLNALPAAAKFSYFTSLIYWWTYFRRFVYVITPLLFAFFGIVFLDATLQQLLFIWVPFMVLSYLGIEAISGRLRSPRLTSVFDTILFPYMVLPILAETLGVKMKKFAVTPKEKKVNFRNTEPRHT
ncbi:MAG: glycosyltransferase family 2 protein, partial [Christensenellaceae bacterium]